MPSILVNENMILNVRNDKLASHIAAGPVACQNASYE